MLLERDHLHPVDCQYVAMVLGDLGNDTYTSALRLQLTR
jgi:hypothetical protein